MGSSNTMDDIDELLALVDGDEKIEEGKQITEDAESSLLEKEYLELEKKMREIQEKMKKKPISPNSTIRHTSPITERSECNSAETMPSGVSKEPPRSSFLAAFGNASFSPVNSQNDQFKTTNATDPKLKRLTKHINNENDPPPQKKRRVTHLSDVSPHSSATSVKNNGDTKFYSKTSKMTNLKQNSINVDVAKAMPNCEQPQAVSIEHFSMIRLRKCFVPNSEIKSRMEGKKFLRISLIRTTMKMSEDFDWVTVGCISKQTERQAAKSGKPFSILNLTDLDDCTKTVSFFLFGNVHEKLFQQIAVGSVIGILNPTIMPPKKEDSSYSDVPALTVDVAERVMHIGLASDLGWCKAVKYRNKQPAGKCLAVINKRYSNVCIFHMKSNYKKARANRSELQGAMGQAPVAKKFKSFQNVAKNDQFFYGGKLYSTNPSPKNAKRGPESKIKLSKFLANHSDLADEGRKELMEKSKVMNALGGMKGHHEVSGCSDAFATMLASGDNIAGSRQFLNHLHKLNCKEEAAKVVKAKAQTPAEFLKLKGDVIKSKPKKITEASPKTAPILERIKQNKGASTSGPPTKFITANDIKRATVDMLQARRMQMLGSVPKLGSKQPQLGRGLSNGEIDLFGDDFSENLPPVNTDLKKKKAIAKLRNDEGNVSIQKSNPNRGVLQQIHNVRDSQAIKSKILEKVNKNRSDMKENDEEEVEEVPKPKFGTFSEEEFNDILNSKSVYSKDVETSEIEEHEKYFNPLIKKEMMEKKMSETFEIPSKIVSCIECDYTFWGPHEKCKERRHHLNWSSAKKRFFECSHCKCRTTTWKTYPTKACRECGSSKNWHRTSMLKEKDVKVLDADVLLIRGLEHGKFLNSLM